jgi:hypothetical protein
MFVLIFCTRVFGKFLILKITGRDGIKNLCRFSCEMPVILVRFRRNFEFFSMDFRKILKYKIS